MHTDTSNDALDLREYLRPILSRLPLILAVVVVVTGATYFYYSNKPDVYASSTQIMVGSSELDQLLLGAQGGRSNEGVENLAVLARTEPVAREAAQRLGYKGNPRDLLGGVQIGAEKDSDFLTIQATSSDPNTAAAVANAFAKSFIAVTASDRRRAAGVARRAGERQLALLGDGDENRARRLDLLARLERLRAIEDLPAKAAGTRQLDEAVPNPVPVEPKPRRNAIFAFVVSLMLAIAGAFGLERLDRRLRRPEDVESLYPVPNLAELPGTSNPAPSEDGAAVLPGAFREPLRMLRTNLDLASLDNSLRTILITSAGPREGKSTVVRNLALAYRESGARVAVIDTDLRRPTLDRLLPVEREPGLINVLTGAETLERALQTAAVHVEGMETLIQMYSQNGGNGNGHGASDLGRLAVLTAGPTPANPPAVLAAERMRVLLRRIAEHFDVVLVDTPPMLAFSDAVPLVSEADGVLVVARLGTTTSDAAKRLMTRLERIPGANVLGVVANDVGKRAQAQRNYAYHYYGYARA
jgi:polysaccharide biosynthesis transport protein